jgi:hypothetical protein
MMDEADPTTYGSIKSSVAQRKKFAKGSHAWNKKNKIFQKYFLKKKKAIPVAAPVVREVKAVAPPPVIVMPPTPPAPVERKRKKTKSSGLVLFGDADFVAAPPVAATPSAAASSSKTKPKRKANAIAGDLTGPSPQAKKKAKKAPADDVICLF